MQEQKTEILRMEYLKKYFTTPKGISHAVDDANFSICTGETLGVVRESGCGKSAMGRAILRLHEPISDKVYPGDGDILGCNKKQLEGLRKDMQIIFQDSSAFLDPRIAVSETIIEPSLMQGIYRASERIVITQRVEKIMNLVGLAKRLVNTHPHELDGGRRQRIGIARALAVNPKFIVCNEPVSALDIFIQVQILNLMQDLQEELSLTYMFITHDLSVVRHFSNDIVVMYLEQMVESVPAGALFKNPMHPYTEVLLSAIPVPDPDSKMERISLKGKFTSPTNLGPGCRLAERCPYATEDYTNNEVTLKEMELEHFMSCCMVQRRG